jgi:hypothetical protein
MLQRATIILATFVSFGVTACGGPAIKETRLGFYPAREPACTLEYVQWDPRILQANGPWEILGYLEIDEKNPADPFSPKYRSIVRPRACHMGGEAVSLVQSASRDARFGSGAGSTWAVMRHRQMPGAPPPPPTAF